MPEEGPFKLSHVLAEELEVIRGPIDLDAYDSNADLLPAERPGLDAEETEEANRRSCYYWAHQSELSALCLSGGGIRSAAISLGVIQALADAKLLGKFDYLSTVSGGGYIGCWLSAWLYWNRKLGKNSDDVLNALKPKRDVADKEPPPIRHLREYSNYLTRRVGLFSADTWAAVAIVLRNIVVNWLILLPVLALVVIAAKLATLAMTKLTAVTEEWVAFSCLVFGGLAFGYKLGRLYSGADLHRAADRKAEKVAQGIFIRWSLVPALLGGACFVWLALLGKTPADPIAGIPQLHKVLAQIRAALPELPKWFPPVSHSLLLMLVFAGAVYALALVVAALEVHFSTDRASPGSTRRFAIGWWDFLAWLGGVAVFAAVIWAGTKLLSAAGDGVTPVHDICAMDANLCVSKIPPEAITINRNTLAVIFGVPWFLLATILAHDVYLLLRSMSIKGDVEREWLGRGSGWHFIAGLGWIMLSAVVLFGPSIYENIPLAVHLLTVVSGTVTALLGKSGLTPAAGGATGDWKGFGAKVALAIAGPLFAVLLLMLLSVAIDWAVHGSTNACFPTDIGNARRWDCADGPYRWGWLTAGVVLILGGANILANVNAFSLHAIYRNRLIRCFLGAPRAPYRKPDNFTDFDWHDDLRVDQLWNERDPAPRGDDWRPLQVINMTLNLTEPNRLAWQQRKAMPFTVTPFFCGNADLGYRTTNGYGGRERVDPKTGAIVSGITLGTALAISGAAVSSNMGYHSSMSLSFLLTFFNVRLGVWLGNPGWRRPSWQRRLPGWLQKAWRPFRYAGPLFSAGPLIFELFGLTNTERRYVYLSDGGHFENLGLYEMVRRRCKWIVVVDAGQDGKRAYVDLGNAVRKIWIDLGIRITFDNSPLLKADKDTKRPKCRISRSAR